MQQDSELSTPTGMVKFVLLTISSLTESSIIIRKNESSLPIIVQWDYHAIPIVNLAKERVLKNWENRLILIPKKKHIISSHLPVPQIYRKQNSTAV